MHDVTIVTFDSIGYSIQIAAKYAMRTLFVLAGKPAVTSNVTIEDGR
jgi:hypothetical protein